MYKHSSFASCSFRIAQGLTPLLALSDQNFVTTEIACIIWEQSLTLHHTAHSHWLANTFCNFFLVDHDQGSVVVMHSIRNVLMCTFSEESFLLRVTKVRFPRIFTCLLFVWFERMTRLMETSQAIWLLALWMTISIDTTDALSRRNTIRLPFCHGENAPSNELPSPPMCLAKTN